MFVLLGACLLLLAFASYANAISLSNVLNVEDQARLKQTLYNAMPFKDLETAGYAVFSLKLMNAEVPPTQVITNGPLVKKFRNMFVQTKCNVDIIYVINCIILFKVCC